ncbi:MAG TPA: hypothetical protein QGG47_03495 [Acidobacteriota bacterium]|nr:hypothetical protein [Acidobacteriota bacterium]
MSIHTPVTMLDQPGPLTVIGRVRAVAEKAPAAISASKFGGIRLLEDVDADAVEGNQQDFLA